MDPLNLVASLIGVSLQSQRLLQLLYEYTANIRDKSGDMTRLIDELQRLQVLFEAVNQVLTSDALPGDGGNETSREPLRLALLTVISRCAEDMQTLDKDFLEIDSGRRSQISLYVETRVQEVPHFSNYKSSPRFEADPVNVITSINNRKFCFSGYVYLSNNFSGTEADRHS
jgi:hypothetical protein